MARSLAQVDCARALLFTDAALPDLPAGIERIAIAPLRSLAAYSHFVLHRLADWIETSHCLIVQWDGFIAAPDAWDPAFLACDYIGAPWPQFAGGHDVGNGGFSLRSRRLMLACREPGFHDDGSAEDLVIARVNRVLLEDRHGIVFAERALASRFSRERDGQGLRTFGFHGVFNLPGVVGIDGFWELYRSLDHRGPVRTDFWPLLRAVAAGPAGLPRALRMGLDRLKR
ncbi:MAG: hypothetical protein K2X68_05065 [Novosphingobium sp.]|nr:hypothetical protein [Novosphingobium sp.]